MTISPLNIADTFQTWFNKTNTIISELNGVTVHNIIAGDGIGLTSSGNIFTISHGSNVSTGITFTGAVKFTNTVSFSTSPSLDSLIVNVSPKVTGITIGNVVRIGSTGLTLAKANTAENAEVLGVVISEDSTSFNIATAGSINNKTFANTIPNLVGMAGGTLGIGCAYFLNPVVAGGITTVEPTTYGQVSKPLILGISGDCGSILLHRGIQVDGISAGITAELDNRLIVQIDYTNDKPLATKTETPKPGDVVTWYPDPMYTTSERNSVIGQYYNDGSLKVAGSLNGSGLTDCIIPNSGGVIEYGTGSRVIGVVSKVLVDTGSVMTLEIITQGGSGVFKKSEMSSVYDFSSQDSGVYFWDSSGFTFRWMTYSDYLNSPTECFANIIANNDSDDTVTYTFVNSRAVSSGPAMSFMAAASSGGLTGMMEYENIIPNGSFTIWQRPFTNISGMTLGGITGLNLPLADRWFYMADSYTLLGLTLNIEKQTFDADQIAVPGSPYYWIDLSQRYTNSGGLQNRPRLENVQKGARLLQGQEATISFWAMAGVCGATMDIVYNRYTDSLPFTVPASASAELETRETIQSGVELSTYWNEYSYTFTPTQQTVIGVGGEGWFGIGFEFPSSGTTLSIAQVKVELGSDTADYLYTRPEIEIERCSPYYLRTYDWNQSTGYTGTSKLNEQVLTLGNLLSQKTYDVKFTTQMVGTPAVILYSPSGTANEAFNVTKNADMRYPRCEGCPIHVNLPWDTSTVRTSLSSGNITVTNTSKNGMQLTINNGATHLDTLKFHYIADADFKLKI